MSSGRDDLHYLNTSRCLEANSSLKGMLRILESLIHALTKGYCLGTLLEAKDINVTTSGQRKLKFELT